MRLIGRLRWNENIRKDIKERDCEKEREWNRLQFVYKGGRGISGAKSPGYTARDLIGRLSQRVDSTEMSCEYGKWVELAQDLIL